MQPCGSERPNWELWVKLFPILVGKTEKCIISCKTVEKSAGSNIYYAPIMFGAVFIFTVERELGFRGVAYVT